MKHIDNYVSALNIRTNDPDVSLFPISQGVETLAIISALQVPSVLIQVPVNIVKLFYKIYLFLMLIVIIEVLINHNLIRYIMIWDSICDQYFP